MALDAVARDASPRDEARYGPDVVAATRKLRKPKRNGRSQVRDAFVQSLGTVASLSGVQVHERACLMTFANVPVAAFERFLAARGRSLGVRRGGLPRRRAKRG